MRDIFLLLGSNRGNRQDYLKQACDLLQLHAGTLIRSSSVYETEPWGFSDDIPFLNQVLEIDTQLSPEDLLTRLLETETRLGRIRPDANRKSCATNIQPYGQPASSYSGRTIDIDLLFYGDQLIFTDTLMVPHPRLHERRFTLSPLAEIAPEFIHPLLKKTISVILQNCNDRTGVVKWAFL